MLTSDDIHKLSKVFATKEDFEKLEEKISNLPTKGEFFGKMDKVIGELQTMRNEHIITGHQVSDHEDRLEALEKIHPHGTHAPR